MMSGYVEKLIKKCIQECLEELERDTVKLGYIIYWIKEYLTDDNYTFDVLSKEEFKYVIQKIILVLLAQKAYVTIVGNSGKLYMNTKYGIAHNEIVDNIYTEWMCNGGLAGNNPISSTYGLSFSNMEDVVYGQPIDYYYSVFINHEWDIYLYACFDCDIKFGIPKKDADVLTHQILLYLASHKRIRVNEKLSTFLGNVPEEIVANIYFLYDKEPNRMKNRIYDIVNPIRFD